MKDLDIEVVILPKEIRESIIENGQFGFGIRGRGKVKTGVVEEIDLESIDLMDVNEDE